MQIEIEIPGEAVPWARAGGGKTMMRFTPPKQRNYMAVIKDFGGRAMAERPPLNGPLALSIRAVYFRPKSHTKKQRESPGAEWRTKRPDADNISKLICDALNGIVWIDDAQVTRLYVEKVYGDRPRVEMVVKEL